MCAAREPRRFNGLCGTCNEVGHLSCHCLLQRDRIYSDVPTLSPPPQINRSGRGRTGYDLPMLPPSYSGRSGGTGYNVPWPPPQYSGSNSGYGTNEGPQQQYGRGAGGSAGCGVTFAQQQPAPRPFRSFGWDQKYACRNGPPVNGGLSNSIGQGQAQRHVGVDDQEEGRRPSTEVEYHGGPLSEVFDLPKSVEQQRATTTVMVDLFPRCPDPRRQPYRWQEGRSLYRHATSDRCNHLARPSHRQPPLSRTRPLRSGFSRTIWRCRCSPFRRDRSSGRRRQWHLLQQHLRLKRGPAPVSSPLCR